MLPSSRIVLAALIWTTCHGASIVRRSMDGKTTSCGLTKLRASATARQFTSPGYPGEFAEQTQCTWLIEAPKGYRVKAKILDIGLINNCVKQYLLFTDTLTGKTVGPICGKGRLDDVISAGRSLRVLLESNSVDYSKPYRGFKLAYMQSAEMPSPKMQDAQGQWRKYMIPSATLAPTAGPTDSVVDLNDNKKINDKNFIENEKNRIANEARSVANYVPVPETKPQKPQKIQPTLKPTTFPGRWVPGNRGVKKPTMKAAAPRPSARPIYPTKYRLPPRRKIEPDNEPSGSNTAKYAGIIFGVLILLVVVVLIAFKLKRRPKKKDKNGENSTNTTESSGGGSTVPKPHHGENYETIDGQKDESALRHDKPVRLQPYHEIRRKDDLESDHKKQAEGNKAISKNNNVKIPPSDINGNNTRGTDEHTHRSEARRSKPTHIRTRHYEEINETRKSMKRRNENGREVIPRKDRLGGEIKKTRVVKKETVAHGDRKIQSTTRKTKPLDPGREHRGDSVTKARSKPAKRTRHRSTTKRNSKNRRSTDASKTRRYAGERERSRRKKRKSKQRSRGNV